MKLGQKTKDGLIVIKLGAPRSEFVKSFLPGMKKSGLVHKSQIGSKIPKTEIK